MIGHLVTKGFDSIPFLVTQGLGDYGTVAAPDEAVGRGGDPVPGDKKSRPRRIKRETYEARGKTLRDLFSETGPRIAPQPEAVLPSVTRETLSLDATPLVEGLTTLRRSLEAAALAQAKRAELAIEEDDAEVLMVMN